MKIYSREIKIGILASTLLLALYFLIMILATRSIETTLDQFRTLWYWMILLSTGFGIQIGLFMYLKDYIKDQEVVGRPRAVAATSTGTSTVSMVACCAHHLTEILPILGLSGAAILLTRYQVPFILFGVFMNVIGIIYMMKQIKKVKNHTTL